MGYSSPLHSPSAAAAELKAVAKTQTPVVDVGDCPSRDSDEFWDWMGKCVDADGRDITNVVSSNSGSSGKPFIAINPAFYSKHFPVVPKKLISKSLVEKPKPRLFEWVKNHISNFHEWFFSKVGPFSYFFYIDAVIAIWGVIYAIISHYHYA